MQGRGEVRCRGVALLSQQPPPCVWQAGCSCVGWVLKIFVPSASHTRGWCQILPLPSGCACHPALPSCSLPVTVTRSSWQGRAPASLSLHYPCSPAQEDAYMRAARYKGVYLKCRALGVFP